MKPKLVDQRTFHAAARAGRSGLGVTRAATVLRADIGGRTVRFVLSDSSIDRMNDTVNVGGWDLTDFRKNPVVLFAHDSSSPPIGRATRVWNDGTRLLGDVEFADKETYAFADTIFRLVKGGFLKSGSVGFLPVDYTVSNRPTGGIDYQRQKLLEFSIVPVPANANALTQAQAKGILSRHDARRLRRVADEMPAAVIGNCGRPSKRSADFETLVNAPCTPLPLAVGMVGMVAPAIGTAAKPRPICASGAPEKPAWMRR